MDHEHTGHEHGGMGDMCNMNMLFTWDTNNLCIIFRSWHVRSTGSLIWYLFLVVILTAGYELVREVSRRYENVSAQEGFSGRKWLPVDGVETRRRSSDSPDLQEDRESSSLLWPDREGVSRLVGRRRSRLIKGLLYAVQVFYSFFIMLLFMTYNGYVMLAVAAGAFIGYVTFGNSSATKSVACH